MPEIFAAHRTLRIIRPASAMALPLVEQRLPANIAAMNENDVWTVMQWATKAPTQRVREGLEDPPVPVVEALQAISDAADAEDEGLQKRGIRALFAEMVEACNDRLDLAGRDAYAAFFPAVVWRIAQGQADFAAALADLGLRSQRDCYASYHQRRRYATPLAQAVPLPDQVGRIALLSRVTVGADILLTSLLCQRLHQAFPQAQIRVLGDPKLQGLLGGLPQVQVAGLSYARRGRLSLRLAAWQELRQACQDYAADLIISPDSRLDQLGVLPLSRDPQRYLLWENTQPQSAEPRSLARLLDDWALWSLGLGETEPMNPRIAFDPPTQALTETWRGLLAGRPSLAVKFDHGGNPDKALPRPAEVQILRTAVAQGWRILLDRGFGAEECANSDALLAASGLAHYDLDQQGQVGEPLQGCSAERLTSYPILRFHGSIAAWAAGVAASQAAISYDSVGHHLAAALGVPLLSIFTGHHHPAFPIAWAPCGPGPIRQLVIPREERTNEAAWQRVLAAMPQYPG